MLWNPRSEPVDYHNPPQLGPRALQVSHRGSLETGDYSSQGALQLKPCLLAAPQAENLVLRHVEGVDLAPVDAEDVPAHDTAHAAV